MLADMICQFRVRTCPDRTRATGARVRLRLFERAIDAGTRDAPHARNSRQTITASKGGRECMVQNRVDALLVGSDPFFANRREQIIALAAQHAIPTIYGDVAG